MAKSTAKSATASASAASSRASVVSKSGGMLATGRGSGRSVSRSAVTGRFVVSARVRAAAARARVAADVKRGVDTPGWIRELAGQ